MTGQYVYESVFAVAEGFVIGVETVVAMLLVHD